MKYRISFEDGGDLLATPEELGPALDYVRTNPDILSIVREDRVLVSPRAVLESIWNRLDDVQRRCDEEGGHGEREAGQGCYDCLYGIVVAELEGEGVKA